MPAVSSRISQTGPFNRSIEMLRAGGEGWRSEAGGVRPEDGGSRWKKWEGGVEGGN